jgi:MFS family permease
VAFAAVHLSAVAPGADTLASRQAALGALIVGGLVGLAALERFVETRHARRVLGVGCALSVVSTITLALAPDLLTAGSALFVLGIGSSVLHPLVKARAYASLPGRPMLVNAVAAALVPLDAIAPLLIGALVYATHPSVGMLALSLAPLGVIALSRRADRVPHVSR